MTVSSALHISPQPNRLFGLWRSARFAKWCVFVSLALWVWLLALRIAVGRFPEELVRDHYAVLEPGGRYDEARRLLEQVAGFIAGYRVT